MNHLSIFKVFRSVLALSNLVSIISVVSILYSPTSYADVVKPALIEISTFTNGKFSIELRASIEAMMTGIDGRYKNTQDAPNAGAYDELRALQPDELAEKFTPFQQQLIKQISLKFDDKNA